MRITLTEAIWRLKSGEVIAVPTETVYGLAACLDQPEAIEKIFSIKGRPKINPLIIHIAHQEHIQNYTSGHPPYFQELTKAFWPGPLTCILPIIPHTIPSIARAGLPTGGFRVPSLELTRQLIESTGPLVMPSANLSGKPSSTCPEHIEEDFGIDFPVLDGGMCSKGLESTILFFTEGRWAIVRLGALPPQAFEPILGYIPVFLEKGKNDIPLSPGQLFRHYAPKANLLLEVDGGAPYILGFEEREYPNDKTVVLLGSLFNPAQVAQRLYETLRYLDQIKATKVWVDMNFPHDGLWETIRERLLRASKH